MIGFYGTTDEESGRVNSLGFLMYDPECTGTPALSEDEIAQIEAMQTKINQRQPQSSSLGTALGLVFGLLAVIGLVIAGIFAQKWFKKKHPQRWQRIQKAWTERKHCRCQSFKEWCQKAWAKCKQCCLACKHKVKQLKEHK